MNVVRSYSVFVCGNEQMKYLSQYKYLGIVLTDFFNYSVTAKIVAQSANRAV